MTKKPDTGVDAPPSRARWTILRASGAGVLVVLIVLALREPGEPPVPQAAAPPAPSAMPAPSAAEPPPSVAPSADRGPPAADQAAAISSPAALDPQEEQTLYLTIVGDKVYRVMGPVSGRPPRIDQLTAPVQGQNRPAASPGVAADRPGAGFVIADAEPPPPVLGPDERPMGPAPQECPRTLPPGTDQATVDGLRRQSGCRYLSSCTADTNECTFFYQGRG